MNYEQSLTQKEQIGFLIFLIVFAPVIIFLVLKNKVAIRIWGGGDNNV